MSQGGFIGREEVLIAPADHDIVRHIGFSEIGMLLEIPKEPEVRPERCADDADVFACQGKFDGFVFENVRFS